MRLTKVLVLGEQCRVTHIHQLNITLLIVEDIIRLDVSMRDVELVEEGDAIKCFANHIPHEIFCNQRVIIFANFDEIVKHQLLTNVKSVIFLISFVDLSE